MKMAFEYILLACLLVTAAGSAEKDPQAASIIGVETHEDTARIIKAEESLRAIATDSLLLGHGEADSRVGAGRRKRGYAMWAYPTKQQVSGYNIDLWKPAVYQLNRPYFIPIYGPPGRIPMYFPPQPVNVNPGMPPDNPIKPYQAPKYLPPKETPPSVAANGMGIGNRNMYDEDEEERPYWGVAKNNQNNNQSPGIAPTRPPRPPNQPEFPALVHDVGGNGANQLAAGEDVMEMPAPNLARPQGAPPPALPMRPTGVRTTTVRPPAVNGPSGPSNCVWAVVSCCSTVSTTVPESCFEQRGCPGPFWDRSPCDSDFARAAIETALNYYNQ